ncbi:MAG TPA: polyhydroxyalkanoic acid system family protein [Phenylobacterium sp.]|nr:polyhydroxyalkanoic acid system family protein [Phenylobacterium sp.]
MSKPITITIPHQLGREEAQRRIADGFQRIGGQFGPSAAKALKTTWAGDRMDFQVQAMGQAVTGKVDVQDAAVEMQIVLPTMLAMMAGSVKDRIQHEGQLMLEKKTNV